MRAYLFVAALGLSGCVGEAPAPAPVCDPLSVTSEGNDTLVTVTFRNCTAAVQVVSAQWCNAPWTPMTVRVLQLPAGRVPLHFGVLAGDGPSRALEERFIERCPEDFESVAPQGGISARIPWNGTYFDDPRARGASPFSNFACPTWRALDPGFYALEAIVWPIEGGPWDARVRVSLPAPPPDGT